MPTPWLPGPSNQEGALSRLEKFMDTSVIRPLKAKSGSPELLESPNSMEAEQSPMQPLVQQYPVEARSVSGSLPQGEGTAAGSEAKSDHESESDMEIQTVFLGSDASKAQDKAPLGHGLPKSSIQDDRQHLHNRTAEATEETSSASFNGNGGNGGFNATSWVSQVVSQDSSSSFASQNLKYMKALNDPYVKALAAHRRELNASRIDLEREYVDTMASKLSTQRSGALATLNVRDGSRGRLGPSASSLPDNIGRCQCYGLDNSICENDSAKEAENEKVVMVPYYAAVGQLPAEDTSRSAASSGYGPTTGRASSEDMLEGHPSSGSSWSMPWLSSMSNKIPALPDILSVVVGAEPLNSARQHKDPQRQMPLSELIDGMETQL